MQINVILGFDRHFSGGSRQTGVRFDFSRVDNILFGKNSDPAVFKRQRRIGIYSAEIDNIGNFGRFQIGQNFTRVHHLAAFNRYRIQCFDFALDRDHPGGIDRQIAGQNRFGRQFRNAAVLSNHLIYKFFIGGRKHQ